MCTWMTELPTRAKSAETVKRPNLMVYIKSTPPKEYYRFRLLGFRSAKSDRDYPFIERYLHTIWIDGEDGKRHSESIVCPITPYVKKNWNGDPMNDCPICRFANANFAAWKQSGWKDKESAKKNKEFGRKFEAIIPVYVVSDPVYPQNNGHFKVFTFTDKEEYKKFKDMVMAQTTSGNVVFNGKNALDFYIRYETVEEVKNEGQPNEYHWKHNVIQKMGFTNKPYDIPAITKEAVDAFPYDETYYVGNTLSELQDFYNRHVKVSNDDIPDDDEEINLVQAAPKQESVVKTNSIEKTEIVPQPASQESLSDLPFDDPIEEEPIQKKTEDVDAVKEIDDLLDEEDESPKTSPKAKPAKEESKDDILESPKDPMGVNKESIEDIDAMLDGII